MKKTVKKKKTNVVKNNLNPVWNEKMSFDVAGDRGQQQRQAWQDQNDNNGEAFRGRAFRAALDTAGDAADTAVNGALRLRTGSGLVDITSAEVSVRPR